MNFVMDVNIFMCAGAPQNSSLASFLHVRGDTQGHRSLIIKALRLSRICIELILLFFINSRHIWKA